MIIEPTLGLKMVHEIPNCFQLYNDRLEEHRIDKVDLQDEYCLEPSLHQLEHCTNKDIRKTTHRFPLLKRSHDEENSC